MITRRRRKRQGLTGQHHRHVPDNRMIKNIARQSITKGILFICGWTGTDGVRIRRVRFANWRVCGICWIVLTTVHTNRPNQLPKIYYIQPCTMMIIIVGNMDRGGGGVAGGGFWNDIHISRSACYSECSPLFFISFDTSQIPPQGQRPDHTNKVSVCFAVIPQAWARQSANDDQTLWIVYVDLLLLDPHLNGWVWVYIVYAKRAIAKLSLCPLDDDKFYLRKTSATNFAIEM